MVSIETFRELALALPGTTEEPHFEKTSFRAGKKIYATLDTKENKVCVKLNLVDQDVFSAFDKAAIFPVPNKWGKLGWTNFMLKLVRKDMLLDALVLSYESVAPKKSGAGKSAKKNKSSGIHFAIGIIIYFVLL